MLKPTGRARSLGRGSMPMSKDYAVLTSARWVAILVILLSMFTMGAVTCASEQPAQKAPSIGTQ